MEEFQLNGQEFIALNKFLKLTGQVESGGRANQIIPEGSVSVNGKAEFQKRKKLKSGDTIEYLGRIIQITAENENK
ncbi:MAG: RNA-binding S4 domain-containing protein [Bacteroidia bacterium]|nr:RNA-binding S4 domain-containing protein [Bacteroidia bacterium]